VAEVYVSQRVNVHLASTPDHPNGGIVTFYPGLNTVPPGAESEVLIANLIVASAEEVALAHQAEAAVAQIGIHAISVKSAMQEAEKERLDTKTAAGEAWAADNQAAIDTGMPFSTPHHDPVVQRSYVLTAPPGFYVGVSGPPGGTAPPVTEVDPTSPPVNRDVPMVSGGSTVGSTLSCTMGNWDNMGTGEVSYEYQWLRNGSDPVGASPTYTTVTEDAGAAITCVVTATNVVGSTAAPASNAVTINGSGTHAARVLPES